MLDVNKETGNSILSDKFQRFKNDLKITIYYYFKYDNIFNMNQRILRVTEND